MKKKSNLLLFFSHFFAIATIKNNPTNEKVSLLVGLLHQAIFYCMLIDESFTHPKGIEPLSQEPESCVISTTLRMQYFTSIPEF